MEFFYKNNWIFKIVKIDMEDLDFTNWTPQILKLNMANLKPSNWTW